MKAHEKQVAKSDEAAVVGRGQPITNAIVDAERTGQNTWQLPRDVIETAIKLRLIGALPK